MISRHFSISSIISVRCKPLKNITILLLGKTINQIRHNYSKGGSRLAPLCPHLRKSRLVTAFTIPVITIINSIIAFCQHRRSCFRFIICRFFRNYRSGGLNRLPPFYSISLPASLDSCCAIFSIHTAHTMPSESPHCPMTAILNNDLTLTGIIGHIFKDNTPE